jgi:O-antigen/teichoic acid export membrane protein
MSTIRRQSIISSVIVYSGFALGALNTVLYGRGLTPAQYGLITGIFVSIGSIMYAVANLGTPSYVTKFYPYYHDHLPASKNDMLSWALLVSLVGFALVTAAGIIFKPMIIRKFGHNSAELVQYFYWIFPFGLGLTLFSVLEAYGWQMKASILTNYLREFQWRLFNLVLIGLLFAGILANFDLFIKLYAFSYLFIALFLLFFLFKKGQLHFTLTPSRVTKRFLTKIGALMLMAWTSQVMFNLSFFFAAVVLAAVVPEGLTAVGIFTLAQYIASLVQAPQRGVASAAVGPLSRAWKEKDHGRIRRIYNRSSINQLIFSVGMFILISLNFQDGILTFGLKQEYLQAFSVFVVIGLTRIIDMGTGVNGQIIGTSIFWRFDLFTGLILVSLTLLLNYWLAKRLGVIGPAIADLITFSLYNGIRCAFLYYKYEMQPFGLKTLYTVLLGGATYVLCHWLFSRQQGFGWLVLRSATILFLYISGVLVLRLSEDVGPVWNTVKKRLGLARPR